MKIIDNKLLCELDNCVYPDYIRKYICKEECKYCIDSILYAEAEAEAMLRENPEYIDGDGNIKKIKL